jgi:hypothetical protein
MGTGLRFGNVVRIEPKMIKTKKINGKTTKYIELETQKTKTPVKIPLTENIDKILSEKYKYDLKRSYRGGTHTISNDKGNEYLKEVLGLLKLKSLDEFDEDKRKSGTEITEKKGTRKDFITFHSGRKFFICNCLVSGIPLNIIMGYTGHNGDWDVFKRYIDKEYGEELHINKLPF